MISLIFLSCVISVGNIKLREGPQGLAHVHTTVLTIQFHCLQNNREPANDSCRKFAFEHFMVSHENLMIKVIFVIRVPFVCCGSMH